MITLYFSPSIHRNWIVEQDGDHYLVPAFANGWNKRRKLPPQDPARVATWEKCDRRIHGRNLALPA